MKVMTYKHNDTPEKGSKPINRSVNEEGGIEFTWSVWLFVDDLDYMKGQFKHVFHKGNDDFKTSGDFKGLNLAVCLIQC